MKNQFLPLILTLSCLATTQAATWVGGSDLAANEKPDGPQELSNPNLTVPQWSYGYRAAVNSTSLTLFAAANHVNSFSGSEDVEGWASPGNAFGIPIVLANVAGVPITSPVSLNPNELLMHPNSGGAASEYVVARWTAPSAGLFTITTNWRDVDPNGGDGIAAYLVLNGTALFTANVPNGLSAADSRSLTLSTGDQLDFVVGPGAGGSSAFDSTAVLATITPEPSTAAMLMLGSVGALSLRRRSLRAK